MGKEEAEASERQSTEMSIDIQIVVLGGTDRTIRCNLVVSGQVAGELQVSREDFTKLSERLFDGGYTLIKSQPVAPSKSDAGQ